jgi:predicted hotdog family 3-hydroxylacyl-ACP dehydratase
MSNYKAVADNLAGARAMLNRAQQQTVNRHWKGWWSVNTHLKSVEDGVIQMGRKIERLERILKIRGDELAKIRSSMSRKRTLVIFFIMFSNRILGFRY